MPNRYPDFILYTDENDSTWTLHSNGGGPDYRKITGWERRSMVTRANRTVELETELEATQVKLRHARRAAKKVTT